MPGVNILPEKYINMATAEGVALKYEYAQMNRFTLAQVRQDLAELERQDDIERTETAERNNAKHALRGIIVQLIKHKIF